MKLCILLLLAVIASGQSWPDHVATTDELLQATDHASTTLSADINASTTTITVASGAAFVAGQVIQIDSEQIKICSVSSNTLTACGRGFAGTTAASHTAPVPVKTPVLAAYYNTLGQELSALESDKFGAIGSTLGVAASSGPGSVSWPYHPVTTGELYIAANNAVTTLTADLDASSLTLTVASASNFVANQILTIGTELMKVCSASGTTITVCSRGIAGTTAATHASGATVTGNISAEMYRRFALELASLESDIFTDFASGSATTAIAWPSHSASQAELLADCLPTLKASCHNKLSAEIIAVEKSVKAGPIPRTIPVGAIELSPGADLQSAVNSHGTGTTFYLHNGTYRMQSVALKTGDKFVGETTSGTILNGSRLLTGWTASGSNWFVGGQTQQGDNVPGSLNCLSDHPRCSYPEDLFVDNEPLFHVANLSDLGPGKWYFDYGADRIYMRDNPSGHTVETSVTTYAFYGAVDDIVIQDMTIEKYATPAQNGVVLCAAGPTRSPQGHRWTVQDNVVRLNHGGAIFASDNMQILRNKVFKNGQIGLNGDGDHVLAQDNEISFNNWAGYEPGWEAGGTKYVGTTNIILRSNYSHDNNGPGLWLDYQNSSFLIEGNHTSNNQLAGIDQEIGGGGIIRNNLVESEGSNPTAPSTALWYSAGIIVSASPNVEVYGNTVSNSINAIGGIQADRGAGFYLQNLYVHDNTITENGNVAGGILNSTSNPVFSSAWNNRWQHNTYTLSGGATFAWNGADNLNTSSWQATGNDTTGTFH